MEIQSGLLLLVVLIIFHKHPATGQFDFSSWLETSTNETESSHNLSANSCKWEDPPDHGFNFRPCATGICKDVPGSLKKNGTIRFTGCETHFVLSRGNDRDTCNNGSWSSTGHKCIECGRSKGKFDPYEDIVLIHYGKNASIGDFPWMAALYTTLDNGRWEQICGGTLISSRLVLSAAHCFTLSGAELKAKDIRVGFGKVISNYYTQEPTSVIMPVIEIIKPERYVGSDHLFDLDIALLVMKQHVHTNSNVMPACIDWRAVSPPQPEETGYLAGYGINEKGVVSSNLKWAFQKFKDYDTCRAIISPHDKKYVTHDKFCVAQVKDAKADKGDSGGGVTFVREGVHYLYGVVSTKLQWEDESNIRLFTSLLNDVHRAWLRQNWYKTNSNGFECANSLDCAVNKACDAGVCVDPCVSFYCAKNDCKVLNHETKCACELTRTCSETSRNATANSVQILPSPYEQVPGEICKQVGDELWSCRTLSECPKAVIAMRNGTKPDMCKYKHSNEKNPVVCCEPYLKKSSRESPAKRLCRLYAQYAKQEDATCGLYKESLELGKTKDVQFKEFTFMAYLTGNNFGTHCTGILISERFIITSAECTVTHGPLKKARLGITTLQELLFIERDAVNVSGEEYEIVATILHPEFKTDNGYDSVALVKLGTNVEFTSLIRPICLNSKHLFPDTYVILTGENEKLRSLMKNTTTKPQQECGHGLTDSENKHQGDERFVCARVDRQDAEEILGQFLIVRLEKPFCSYGLSGVKSFYVPHRSDVLGFTRILFYLSWIENIVWPR